MCPPEHFAVEYAINPWMDTTVAGRHRTGRQAVGGAARDPGRPRPRRCTCSRPRPGLPDMVYAANGAFIGRRRGLRRPVPLPAADRGGRRRTSAFYEARPRRGGSSSPSDVNEGEGDFAYLPGGVRRADPGRARLPHRARRPRRGAGGARPPGGVAAPGRPALLPPRRGAGRARRRATSPTTRGRSPSRPSGCCAQLFPDAVLADEADALAFGLNLVSDGAQRGAQRRGDRRWRPSCRPAGYVPVPVELTELKKGGGSVKCCVAELRALS